MARENFKKTEYAQLYFKLFEQNQLFIHCVKCSIGFTIVNEGKYNLNFNLHRENKNLLDRVGEI